MPLFLSTLSLRRATQVGFTGVRQHAISIHALLAESDGNHNNSVIHCCKFLSTLSLRRATNINSSVTTADKISIHALLAESDHDSYVVMEATKIISIHALLAESDFYGLRWEVQAVIFLSTLSLRRATEMIDSLASLTLDFYPRSPCGERPLVSAFTNFCPDFYPRSPCGERRQVNQNSRAKISISIHALLAESDRKYHTADRVRAYISIHALLAESDPL